MRDLDGSKMRTRVKGRAAITRSLHSLHRRVYRLATCRDLSAADYTWALQVASTIQMLLMPESTEGKR
jgi:hypothetical protein